MASRENSTPAAASTEEPTKPRAAALKPPPSPPLHPRAVPGEQVAVEGAAVATPEVPPTSTGGDRARQQGEGVVPSKTRQHCGEEPTIAPASTTCPTRQGLRHLSRWKGKAKELVASRKDASRPRGGAAAGAAVENGSGGGDEETGLARRGKGKGLRDRRRRQSQGKRARQDNDGADEVG